MVIWLGTEKFGKAQHVCLNSRKALLEVCFNDNDNGSNAMVARHFSITISDPSNALSRMGHLRLSVVHF